MSALAYWKAVVQDKSNFFERVIVPAELLPDILELLDPLP